MQPSMKILHYIGLLVLVVLILIPVQLLTRYLNLDQWWSGYICGTVAYAVITIVDRITEP